jgi:hypothetical protein
MRASADSLARIDKRTDDRQEVQMCRMNEPQSSAASFTEDLQLKEMRAALYNILVSETHAQALEIARTALEIDQERQG